MFSLLCNNRVKSWLNQKDLKSIAKIKHFINKYSWEGNFSSEEDDCKKFEKTNITIALNDLHANKERIYHVYV